MATLFSSLNQAIQTRKQNVAIAQYEEACSAYDAECRSIAQNIVSNILSEIASGDDMNYIMIINQESYSFSTMDDALNNLHVMHPLESPEEPETPDPDVIVVLGHHTCTWHKVIKEALKEAGIPVRVLRLSNELVIFINLEETDTSSKIRILNECNSKDDVYDENFLEDLRCGLIRD